MNKTIVKVFVILGILVLALLIWAFVFGNGLETIFNAIIEPINNIYRAMTGDKADDKSLIPKWNVASQKNVQSASTQAFAAGTH